MKNAVYLLMLSVLLLGGCSGQNESSASAETTEMPDYYEEYVKNPQVTDDRTLQEEGEEIKDHRGEAKLLAKGTDSGTYDIGNIELTVRETKVLHFKPDYSLIDFYHSYTHETEFEIVKMFVEIHNNSDEALQFGPIAMLETDIGEKKLWEDDIYLEELNGEIAPGGTKKGNIGFIVENPDFNSLKITTSDVFDTEQEKQADAAEFEVHFK